MEPLWKGQESLTKVAKFGPFPGTILYKSCLFYPSWQATSLERPPSWVAFVEGFDCNWPKSTHWHFLNPWSHFLPKASFGPWVISSPVSVSQCVYQSLACLHDNSSPVQARITKLGPEKQNNWVKIPIVFFFFFFFFGGGRLTLTFKVKYNLKLKIDPIFHFQ